MVESPRKRLLRIHGQAMNDLDRCLANLHDMYTTYEPTHPDQAVQVEAMAKGLVEFKGILERFKQERM